MFQNAQSLAAHTVTPTCVVVRVCFLFAALGGYGSKMDAYHCIPPLWLGFRPRWRVCFCKIRSKRLGNCWCILNCVRLTGSALRVHLIRQWAAVCSICVRLIGRLYKWKRFIPKSIVILAWIVVGTGACHCYRFRRDSFVDRVSYFHHLNFRNQTTII